MVYLLFKVASAVGMGLVLKRADALSLERLSLIRINYAVAAVIGFFATVALGQAHISGPAAMLAAVTGILFVAGLLIWARAIQAAGLAHSVVAMRTAVVIPLLAAVFIWHEQPSMLEIAGSFVALLALALVLYDVARRETPVGEETTAKDAKTAKVSNSGIPTPPQSLTPDPQSLNSTTRTPRHAGAEGGDMTGLSDNPDRVPSPAISNLESRISSLPSRLWLVLLFLVEGLTMIPALVFSKGMPTNETMPFQTVIFVSAFFVTTLLYYVRRPGLQRDTLKWGTLLGSANFGNYLFLVLALSSLPGLVVYPVIAAGEVGLLAVAGVVLWKEKVGVRSWLGIALTVISVVLIQLGKSA
ncbi:MAG TPA: hypothetical protein VMH22_14260 [bacterium]|nr:hypothetical protein [bacterium]